VLSPKPRGALSQQLLEVLRTSSGEVPATRWVAPEHDEDAALSLWVLYELHHRGFEDVDDDLEWDPALVGLRRTLEVPFEAALRARFAAYLAEHAEPGGEVPAWSPETFFAFVEAHPGRSLAAFVHREADVDQVREVLRLRSVYHLKEADPTAWLVPRLEVRTKAALVELLYDEYGTGDASRLHAGLFARGLDACGLRPEYGAYIDDVPLEILEQNNVMALFGLHRRLRGAALGHLAAFEVTSSLPSRRIAQGLRRVGLSEEMAAYYDEHVEADAVHEQLAVRTICGSLVEEDPALAADVYLGAFACLDLEDRLAARLLGEWAA